MKKRLAQLGIGALIAVTPFTTPFFLQPASADTPTISLDCQGGGSCCLHTNDQVHDVCDSPPPPPCDPDCPPPTLSTAAVLP